MDALNELLEHAARRYAGEPEWLSECRRHAETLLRDGGLPSVREEAWKYTNLNAIKATPFELPQAEADTPVAVDGEAAHLVVVDGVLNESQSQISKLPEGISVQTLQSVARAAPASLQAVFAHDDVAFTALNIATMSDGIVIDVEDDAVIEQPINILFATQAERPVVRAPRLVYRLGRHAQLQVIEQFTSSQHDQGLTNVVTDVMLDEGAQMHHHRLQNEVDTTTHVGRVRAQINRNASFHSNSVVFGGRLTRVDIEAQLRERGAHCVLNGLFVGAGSQHIDHHTTIDHAVGDTTSEQRYRGIVDDRSRGVFNGKVIVRPDAQQISAEQASNNLLLSRQAEIDTKPELEIYADDVRCAHGATVGELDATALFYLRSRGVDEQTARQLLIYAFAETMVNNIPLAGVREAIEQRFLGDTALSDFLEEIRQA